MNRNALPKYQLPLLGNRIQSMRPKSYVVGGFFTSSAWSMSPKRAGIGAIVNNCVNALLIYKSFYHNLNVKIIHHEMNDLFDFRSSTSHVDYLINIDLLAERNSELVTVDAHRPYVHDAMLEKHLVFRELFTFKDEASFRTLTKSLVHEKTLAVHIRGTDKKQEIPEIQVDQLTRTIKEYFERAELEEIFLATDDAFYRNLLIRFFGARVKFIDDVVVSKNGKPLHLQRNRFKINLQAIRDAYVLSQCRHFAYSFSNISHLALTIGSPNFLSLQCLNDQSRYTAT